MLIVWGAVDNIASLAELVGCNKKRQERESYKAHLKPDSAASELVGEVALRTKDSVLTAPELRGERITKFKQIAL